MMKLNVLLLFFTCLSFAQTELHHFEISTDIIWYDANGFEVIYDFVENTFTSNNSFMDDVSISIDGKAYEYKNNKIELDGVIYKFKKPLLESAVYLSNLTDDKTLITFKTSSMNRNAYQKFQSENWSEISDHKQKILLTWARFKQAEYAFHVSYGTSICD